jgi:hypothetical protein
MPHGLLQRLLDGLAVSRRTRCHVIQPAGSPLVPPWIRSGDRWPAKATNRRYFTLARQIASMRCALAVDPDRHGYLAAMVRECQP